MTKFKFKILNAMETWKSQKLAKTIGLHNSYGVTNTITRVTLYNDRCNAIINGEFTPCVRKSYVFCLQSCIFSSSHGSTLRSYQCF
uniref:Uncharacterized protein MANES_01G214400 n=1 Tax=Rhizophora mucronata TaxID=61149 RepID=A0A2P2ISF4_RHIMU